MGTRRPKSHPNLEAPDADHPSDLPSLRGAAFASREPRIRRIRRCAAPRPLGHRISCAQSPAAGRRSHRAAGGGQGSGPRASVGRSSGSTPTSHRRCGTAAARAGCSWAQDLHAAVVATKGGPGKVTSWPSTISCASTVRSPLRATRSSYWLMALPPSWWRAFQSLGGLAHDLFRAVSRPNPSLAKTQGHKANYPLLLEGTETLPLLQNLRSLLVVVSSCDPLLVQAVHTQRSDLLSKLAGQVISLRAIISGEIQHVLLQRATSFQEVGLQDQSQVAARTSQDTPLTAT